MRQERPRPISDTSISQNTFSRFFKSPSKPYYDILVPDVVHEIELGEWKAQCKPLCATYYFRTLHNRFSLVPAASSASKPLSGKVTFKRESSVWLCRLLHVKSMTSYVEQGQNTYNGMKEPPRNSYHQLYMGQVHRSGLPRNPAAASWN